MEQARRNLSINTEESQSPHGSNESARDGPDGKKAVCVAIASSWMFFIVFGTVRSSGVFYEAVIRNMEVSRSEASWPFTLTYSFLSMMGIVTGMLCRVFPLKSLAMIGSVVATLSVGTCFFTRGIITLSLLYGIFQGMGYGLIVVPSVMIVNQYFERHRATANGIQTAGASLGATALPPLIDFLIHKTNNLHLTFFFTSIIVESSIFGAMFYSTPSWIQRTQDEQVPPPTHQDRGPTTEGTNNDQTSYTSSNLQNSKNTTIDCEIDVRCAKYVSLRDAIAPNVSQSSQVNNENTSLLPGGNLNGSSEYRDYATINSTELTASGCVTSVTSPHYSNAKRLLGTSMFWKIWLAYFVLQWDFYLYLLFLVDYGVDRGIPTYVATYLLSAVSLADFCGRIGTGWISDLGYARRGNVVATAALTMATVFLLTPFVTSVYLFCLMAVVAGISSGTLAALVHVLQVEYLGLENLPLAAGLSQLFSGILIMFRPLIIGLFRDTIGSYNGLLFVLCAVGMVTFVVWKVEMMLNNEDRARSGTNSTRTMA